MTTKLDIDALLKHGETLRKHRAIIVEKLIEKGDFKVLPYEGYDQPYTKFLNWVDSSKGRIYSYALGHYIDRAAFDIEMVLVGVVYICEGVDTTIVIDTSQSGREEAHAQLFKQKRVRRSIS